MWAVGGVAPTSAAVLAGDVSNDGEVTTYDARMLLSNLVANVPFTATQKLLADANSDGRVNTSDVKRILDIVMGGGQAGNTVELGTLTSSVSLLPPTADDWVTPLQTVSNVYCSVKTAAQTTSAQTLINSTERDEGVGGAMLDPHTWPYAAYAYDQKIWIPSTATLEYDVTVTCASASVLLYLDGGLPHFDESDYPMNFKLNSFLSSNLDSGSGDLLPGTYRGTIAMEDIIYSNKVPSAAVVDSCLYVSGIKTYVVGCNEDGGVTFNHLRVSAAYVSEADVRMSTDALSTVRSELVRSSETSGLSSLTGLELYQNGARTAATTMNASADNKKIYHTQNKQRVFNYADGYRLDLPYDFEPDYSLSALRSRYRNNDAVLTISKEQESPYGNTLDGWTTYLTEWLNRYVGDENFLQENYIRYTREPIVSETLVNGYTTMVYDMAIDWQGQVEMPFYSVAIIRKFYTYDTFYLLVLKSKGPTDGMMDRLLRSFAEITPQGTAVLAQGQYQVHIPDSWNEETRAYYNKLLTQETTDWGFFSASMVETTDGSYASQYDEIASEHERITQAIGQEYDIMPTYSHLAYGSKLNPFPLDMANEFAGGNGFNGKPVLQFTYQYTVTNNTALSGPTPVFNVLRGDYDAHFRQMARDIKAYGKPVLFRLNNEMNTDWTSYCGLVSLLDPDIFVEGWRRLYDIFEAEGVDNCIWIFNPFTPTYPACSWGDPLCFMPGEEYVQILGLTNYQMGNTTPFDSFQTMYTQVYNESKDHFGNYPWVISEFACGSGGEKQYNWDYGRYESTTAHRNWYAQYTWIVQMFNCLNNRNRYPFCKNIKGAVWFNVNDYVDLDGKEYIVNALHMDESFTYAWSAFKSGIAAGK